MPPHMARQCPPAARPRSRAAPRVSVEFTRPASSEFVSSRAAGDPVSPGPRTDRCRPPRRTPTRRPPAASDRGIMITSAFMPRPGRSGHGCAPGSGSARARGAPIRSEFSTTQASLPTSRRREPRVHQAQSGERHRGQVVDQCPAVILTQGRQRLPSDLRAGASTSRRSPVSTMSLVAWASSAPPSQRDRDIRAGEHRRVVDAVADAITRAPAAWSAASQASLSAGSCPARHSRRRAAPRPPRPCAPNRRSR